MANLSITANNVTKGAGATVEVPSGGAGEAITAGNAVRVDSDNKVWLAKNDTVQNAALYGIALNGAAVGQPVAIQTGGVIAIGATVTVGETYIVSSNAGGIAPIGDISTNRLSYVGYGITAAALQLMPLATGIAHA